MGWPLTLAGFGIFAVTLQWEAQAPRLVAFLIAGAGIGTIAYNMRCPVCGKPPIVWHGSDGNVPFDPAECTNSQCGARLR